jgi:hypothetical protein
MYYFYNQPSKAPKAQLKFKASEAYIALNNSVVTLVWSKTLSARKSPQR